MRERQGNGGFSIHVLKSGAYGAPGERDHLPYRIDLLRRSGVTLTWSDRHLQPTRFDAAWARIESATTPIRQSLAGGRSLLRADAVLAIFESEGHFLALCRSLVPRRLRRGPRLVIVSCWLADLAADSAPRRRRIYRWIYRGVDLVTVFSANQEAVLEGALGIDADRILVVPFGIDVDELADRPTSDGGRVVAAGRDLGRDWPTLATAAADAEWDVDLITRPSQVPAGLAPNVAVHGYLDRDDYLGLLAAASVVALPTHVRHYPTGQTVLLEAMALGKACVVTDTCAMREYVTDGVSAVLVPEHDPTAFRAAVDGLLADPERRAAIGRRARQDALERFRADDMWAAVADRVRAVLG